MHKNTGRSMDCSMDRPVFALSGERPEPVRQPLPHSNDSFTDVPFIRVQRSDPTVNRSRICAGRSISSTTATA
ncbi:hypothetical protein D3C75_1250360 [compost metagenome]